MLLSPYKGEKIYKNLYLYIETKIINRSLNIYSFPLIIKLILFITYDFV
jgi:hypothetical protein